MAIYNIFDYYEKEASDTLFRASSPRINPEAFTTNRIDESFIPNPTSKKDHFFSALAARFFFFLLLIADIAWGIYATLSLAVKFSLYLITFGQVPYLKRTCAKSLLSIKRSIICAIALVIAIFSPALGIMFLCMYFLMYDKNGVDEVVPASLRDQFKDIFPV